MVQGWGFRVQGRELARVLAFEARLPASGGCSIIRRTRLPPAFTNFLRS
jgi:hypothetical protein